MFLEHILWAYHLKQLSFLTSRRKDVRACDLCLTDGHCDNHNHNPQRSPTAHRGTRLEDRIARAEHTYALLEKQFSTQKNDA